MKFAKFLAGPVSRRSTVRSCHCEARSAPCSVCSVLPRPTRRRKEGQEEKEGLLRRAQVRESVLRQGAVLLRRCAQGLLRQRLRVLQCRVRDRLLLRAPRTAAASHVGNDAAPSECCPPERQWFTEHGTGALLSQRDALAGHWHYHRTDPAAPRRGTVPTPLAGDTVLPTRTAPVARTGDCAICCDPAPYLPRAVW